MADLLADVDAMRALPLVRAALPHVGHVTTRNRGTVGGSIAALAGAIGLFKSLMGFILIVIAYWLADKFAGYRVI